MKLVITEKPSVAVDIGKVLNVDTRKDGYLEGNGFVITWCFGHLVQLSYPEKYDEKYKKWNLEDLPIIPSVFKTEVNNSGKKQYLIIKKLMEREDIEEIICATDSAREGELIFRHVYNQAKCKKPFKRLWISSQTEKAVKEGFENLRDGKEYDNIYKSAMCRAEADWLIGLNLTRLYSIKNNYRKLTIGRCQTATLCLIVNRYLDIKNFKKEKYYQLDITCENDIKASYYSKEDNKFTEAKYKSYEIAEGFLKNIPESGVISKYEKTKKFKNRPLLFSLNELQKEANNKYGYTAQETLDIAQILYEKHKITSYPRTGARYLDSNTEYKIKDLVSGIGENEALGYKEYIYSMIDDLTIDNNIINDEAIEDHHALFVTENIKDFDIRKLNEKEKNILDLIIIRILLALSKKQEFEETNIEVKLNETSDILKIKGKNIIFDGWKSLEKKLVGKNDSEKEIEQSFKLDKAIGDEIKIINKEILEKETNPKKQYTDGTLIGTMENIKREYSDKEVKEGLEHGIGTTATRAGIIEKLIEVGYIERKKKNLIPTQLGIQIINVVPNKIKSPELTAEWENKLKEVEKGNLKDTVFIQEIVKFLNEILDYEATNSIQIKEEKKDREVIGKCPRCGKNIYESKSNFYCEGFRDNPKCDFTIWKDDKFFKCRGKKITKSIAKELIKDGQSKVTFKKKDGSSTYEALVKVVEKGKYINFELEFI